MGPLLRQNPGLHLEVVATDKLVDIVAEGFDAGVRFGERLSQDMIAVRIKHRLRFVVVGSLTCGKGARGPHRRRQVGSMSRRLVCGRREPVSLLPEPALCFSRITGVDRVIKVLTIQTRGVYCATLMTPNTHTHSFNQARPAAPACVTSGRLIDDRPGRACALGMLGRSIDSTD